MPIILCLARLRTSVTGTSESSLFRHATLAAGCAVLINCGFWAVLLSLPPSSEITPGACFGPWSAHGCQHDAGSMQFRCAHLIGVLDLDRQQS